MKRIILCLLVSFVGAVFSYASHPATWTVSTQKEFLAGDFSGVSLDSEGKLILSPALKLVYETEQALIHSTTVDKSGNIYLGTGSEGKIFKVSNRQTGDLFADLDENGVFGLAVDALNRVYAASAPGGKVYRIDSQGKAEPFFDPKEKYIWDMVIDRENNLYVATGPQGIIYRVDSKGQGRVFYDSNDTHITSLTLDLDGRLLAGSSSEGLVFRIDSGGRAFVLFDSPMEEIKSLAVDRYGNVFAAGLSFEPGSAESPASKSSKTPNPPPPPAATNGDETIALEGTRKGKRLEIYRIDRDTLVETIYSADSEMAFDLSVRDDGTVLAGTSQKGRVIAISPRKLLRVVVQSPDDQITQLVEAEGNLYAASSNLGKLYQLTTQSEQKGTYESDVLDAKIVSSWGKIRWRVSQPAENQPVLFTRSGNTAKPDATWSDWSAAYNDSAGSGVSSPGARYLQWKSEFRAPPSDSGLTTDRNALESVEVTYLQRNMAPIIQSITVHAPGMAFQKLPVSNPAGGGSLGGPDNAHLRSLPKAVRALESTSPSPPPRKIYVVGARSASWEATDANQDDLVYSVYYRAVDEQKWKMLADGRKERYFTLDGASLPDGTYHFKVLASDRSSNPPDRELESELVSKHFVISNSAPALEVSQPQLQGQAATVNFSASTKVSLVYQAEFSLDAQPWRIIYPQDGISDGNQETFQLQLKDLSKGEHVITIRVIDSVGNIGTGKATFTIP